MQQFADFIHTAAKSELENLSVENDRLDTFLQNRMAIRYPTVWLVYIVEMALLLSHGQPTVERGFRKQRVGCGESARTGISCKECY